MVAYHLKISKAARLDLKDIFQYSQRQWGDNKADQYLDSIKEQMVLITRNSDMGINRPELQTGMHSLVIQSHIVFYTVDLLHINIIRVIHHRQDPNRRLK